MKRKSFRAYGSVAVGLLAVAGCVANNGEGDSDTSSSDISGRSFNVVDTDEDGVPSFITGNLGGAPAASAEATSAAAKMAVSLNVVAPHFRASSGNLVLKNVQTDAIGDTHFRYTQTKNGRPVYGAELVLHTRAGKIYAANGTVREDLIAPAAAPSLASNNAVATVTKFSKRLTNLSVAANPDFAYLQRKGSQALVWSVEVSGIDADGTPVRDTVLVDAATGDVALRIPHIYTAENREVHDAKMSTTLPGAIVRKEGGAATADSVVNGNYANLGNTYDCYKQLFGRDSFDNAGAKLVASVHYDVQYNNAYWDGTQMVYGDGDGVVLSNLAISPDVTAHELTHAVTSATSNLTYSGESGGLNEAMSDIMGETCEWFGIGKPAVPPISTWEVGEDVYTPGTPGDALRYLFDPAKDGSSVGFYGDYNSGLDVHYSSGIANLAFYLMAHGGTQPEGKTTNVVTGIGIEKAAQVFFRANTTIFTASETFAQARTACEQAATQLGYSAEEIASVSAAWAAVGVGKVVGPTPDAGTDSGTDAGPKDSGTDTGTDSGTDAGTDAGGGGGPPTGTCRHSECDVGYKLKGACDPCVQAICHADGYCCKNKWDSICVSEVFSVCGQTTCQ